MTEVTGEQVKEAMTAAGITRVVIRECSMCGYPLAYLRAGDCLAYDAGCNCTGRSVLEPRSWFDAARLINMQSDQVWRNKFRTDFGLPTEEAAP
jgi:hypothetical protein